MCSPEFSGHRSDSITLVQVWQGHPAGLFQPVGGPVRGAVTWLCLLLQFMICPTSISIYVYPCLEHIRHWNMHRVLTVDGPPFFLLEPCRKCAVFSSGTTVERHPTPGHWFASSFSLMWKGGQYVCLEKLFCLALVLWIPHFRLLMHSLTMSPR